MSKKCPGNAETRPSKGKDASGEWARCARPSAVPVPVNATQEENHLCS